MPAIGGYWFWPGRIAAATASRRRGSHSKSGKPWPRLTAPCCWASADITVKIVVPTEGRRDCRTGVRMGVNRPWSQGRVVGSFVVGLAAHDLDDQGAGQALGQQFG